MSNSRRHSVRIAFVLAALVAPWLISTAPWGLGILQLVVFMGPGALLGLATGWMANATTQSAWSWTDGRRAAMRGALLMPPMLAFRVPSERRHRHLHQLHADRRRPVVVLTRVF